MNELHKLRTDNQDLLSKLDRSSLDSLDLLESQIADQKCINSSLQVSAVATITRAVTLPVVVILRDYIVTGIDVAFLLINAIENLLFLFYLYVNVYC